MMFARVVLIALVAMTVIYLSLWHYLRALHRDRLLAEWDGPGDPRLHVRGRMTAYERRLKRRLIVLVYLLPSAAMILFVAITND